MPRDSHLSNPAPTPPDKQGARPEVDLAAKVRHLQAERQQHVRSIEQIDSVLEAVQQALADLGIAVETPEKPAAPIDRPHRRYQKFELTGEESVLNFVRTRGGPTTAEVNAHWHAEGRTGVANPILARLLKRGLLNRETDPKVRGSRYHVSR